MDILNFLNNHPTLSKKLVLKDGTAINLLAFDLPRLSVDIDLDLDGEYTRSETLALSDSIQSAIKKYLHTFSYTLNVDKGKTSHALNSWVLNYENAGGNKDNIKIEINYTIRRHVCPIVLIRKHISIMDTDIKIHTLALEELFGSKIKAFTERIAPRDLYDIYNLLQSNLFTSEQWNLVRKCFWFYRAVGSRGKISRVNFKGFCIQSFLYRCTQDASSGNSKEKCT